MNAATLLLTPWRAAPSGARWMVVVFYLLTCLVATAIAVFGHTATTWLAVSLTYGLGLFAPWAFLFPGAALLAKDARQLRIPRLERLAILALPAYAIAMLALPAAVFAALGWPLVKPMLVWTLVMAGAFAFALLPRYVTVFCGFLPTLGNALAPGWVRLFPHAGSWPTWTIALLVLLLIMIGWRWHGFIRGRISEQGWSSPMVVQLRYGSWGAWSQMQATGRLSLMIGKGGGQVDGCGPSRPIRSLRMALGGWYTPRSWLHHVQQMGIMLVLISVPVGALLLAHLHDGGASSRMGGSALLGAVFGFAAMASPLVCLLSWVWLSRRWQRVNMELPMLALLPGLGSNAMRKRNLLRAALTRPLVAHAICLAVGLIGCHWLTRVTPLIGVQVVAITIGALATTGLMLDILGGKPHSLWTVAPLLGAVFVLQNLGLVVTAMLGSNHAPAHSTTMLAVLMAGWILLAGWATRLALAGWRALETRPQPFVANPA